MKKVCLLVFILSGFFIYAQKISENYSPTQYKTSTCVAQFSRTILKGEINSNTVAAYIKSHLINLKDYRSGVKLNYYTESPGGFHFSFHQTFEGIAIYQTEIKLNIDRNHRIRSIFDNSENTSSWKLETVATDSTAVILLKDNTPVICQRTINHNGIEVFEHAGEIIFQHNSNSYLYQDSTVSGKVYLPDPLTTAQQNYACPYCDHSDTNSLELDAQLQTVNFIARFTGSQFILETDFVRVSDFDIPTAAPATSANGQFYFNRSQSGFEDVNAYYHIHQIRQHISSLGFGCADSLIEIDPHALNGSDNSYYSPVTSPKRIYYGTGGVDDAEDADVCVHEYGHHISETAAPNSNVGLQRNALDEALGDYLAGSYSNSYSTYNNNWVFNWDGHNEYWNGRVLNSSWKYPDDMTNSIYHNAQIWSSVLWCIHNTLGRATTDSLVLQMHYSFSQNISFADAAQLLIDADTLLTGGKYTCPIYTCLFYRGLAPANPLIDCGVGIHNEKLLPFQFVNAPDYFSIMNTESQPVHLQISDMQGRCIAIMDETQPVFTYQNSNLPSGLYFVTIQSKNRAQTYKWCKLH